MALRLSNRTDLNSSSSTTPMRNSSSYSSRSASRRSRKSICQREWSGSKWGSSATLWSASWWSSRVVECSVCVTSSQDSWMVLRWPARTRPFWRRWTRGWGPTLTTSPVRQTLERREMWPTLYLLTHLGNSSSQHAIYFYWPRISDSHLTIENENTLYNDRVLSVIHATCYSPERYNYCHYSDRNQKHISGLNTTPAQSPTQSKVFSIKILTVWRGNYPA